MTALRREREVAAELARRAGALVMEFRGGGPLAVELKPGDEPVTVADRQASELVVAGLEAAFPDDVVISEEREDDRRRLAARRTWYVDPIDGTKDFIAGRPGFAVMIGLTIDQQPALAAIYQPITERLFCTGPADDGAPAAWLHAPGEAPRRLHVSTVTDPARGRLVASASSRSDAIDDVKNALGISDELNVGSVGLKLALIAAGDRDLYVNPSARCKLWDVCAPQALLHAAGGRLTDGTGAPLRYDTEDLGCRRGLVATNGHLHDVVVERLAPVLGRRRG